MILKKLKEKTFSFIKFFNQKGVPIMKKLLIAAVVATMTLTASVDAFSICGGTVVPDNDCGSNQLAYSESCCPSGYRVQGVIYNDLKGQDNADAVGAVCRHVKKGNIKIASDFYNRGNKGRKSPVRFVCESTEVLAGIACKDLPKKDALDGCTAVCQKPGGRKRIMYNADLESNPRAYVHHTIDLPNRVAGIGYKEEKIHSDRADCANISYKYQPIVKP